MRPLIGITTVYESETADSFARMRLGVPYIDAVTKAGGAPVLIPLVENEATLRAIFDRLDGVLIPGGDDVDPARYGEMPIPELGEVSARRDSVELTLCHLAYENKKPLLGICRGIQVMNVALGGTLYQDLPTQCPSSGRHKLDSRPGNRHTLAHPIDIRKESKLAAFIGCTSIQVNSFHHQAVKATGTGLVVSATAPDGVIEGVEDPEHPFFLGVQCHPEDLFDTAEPRWLRLFSSFVKAAEG